jgi:hypothetical protein
VIVFADASVVNISSALTVAALLLAAWQTREARKQTRDLGFVSKSLSTRYIGPFPDYLPEVVDLVTGVRNDLAIIVGNPLPAYFTDPQVFTEYAHAVKRKCQAAVPIRMICMNESMRRRRLAMQFPTSGADWEPWRALHDAGLQQFMRYRFADVDAAKLTHTKLLELLSQVQREVLREEFAYSGVTVQEVADLVPVQVWIADGERAVFSLQTSSSQTMSYGLYTSDSAFVNALYALFELYERHDQLNTLPIAEAEGEAHESISR